MIEPKESYYQCIASNLDKLDFNQTSCTKKCIPISFSYDRNYSTPFCKTVTDNECAFNIITDSIDSMEKKIENNVTKKIQSKCKHSCIILQYSGVEYRNDPSAFQDDETWDYHQFSYGFANG